MSEILDNLVNLFNFGNLNPKTVGLFVTAIIIAVFIIVTVTSSASTSTSGKQNSMRMMALADTAPVKQVFLQTDPDGNISTFDFATTPITTTDMTINGKMSISTNNAALRLTNDNKHTWQIFHPTSEGGGLIKDQLMFYSYKPDGSWESNPLNLSTSKAQFNVPIQIGNTTLTEQELINIKNGIFPSINTQNVTIDRSKGEWSQALIIKAGSKEAPYIDFQDNNGNRNGILMMGPGGALVGFANVNTTNLNATTVNATTINGSKLNSAISNIRNNLNDVCNIGWSSQDWKQKVCNAGNSSAFPL